MLEVCMGRIFQVRTRPEVKIKVSAQTGQKEKLKFRPRPGLAKFFSDFGPDCLGLKDFKTGPFSCLQIIKVFFAGDLFFFNLLKQPI